MSKFKIHQVRKVRPHTRLTDYCATAFPSLSSRSAVKKAIAAGRILLNGKLAQITDTIQRGDKIELAKLKQTKTKRLDVNVNLEIVYEDEFMVAVNKPGGIAVNGNRNKTVENALLSIAKKSYQPDALPHPTAAHRIDVPTKGLVLLAKTKTALIQLNKAFQQQKVKKSYTAIAHGKLPKEGRITAPIQGKKSITEFETLKVVPSRVFQYLSLVKLMPVTGRTHQLRIHLKEEGHLIVGDKQYAERQKTILGKGLFLCATSLEFNHPISGKTIRLEIEAPTRFFKLLDREEERFS